MIYLMNRKPDRALATLQATRTAELSNELRDQRLLLEARAMSDIGRHDLALELIANIDGREAIRLRSDILWAAKRWREAAEQIELLVWRALARLHAAHRGRARRYPARRDRLFARRRNDRPGAVAREIRGQDGGRAGPPRLRCGERADRHQRRRIPGRSPRRWRTSIRSKPSCATCARAIRMQRRCRRHAAAKGAGAAGAADAGQAEGRCRKPTRRQSRHECAGQARCRGIAAAAEGCSGDAAQARPVADRIDPALAQGKDAAR